MDRLRPRIAVVGFGMAGIGCVHALRYARRFAVLPDEFEPEISVFESLPRPGGKAAPANLGAQFLDADALYPFDRILPDLDLDTHAARQDYELVRLRIRKQHDIQAETFGRALGILRSELAVALASVPFAELDRVGVMQFIERLHSNDKMTEVEKVAMQHRLLLEEGTINLSALYYALYMGKVTTPMKRLEVVGGLHRIALAERKAAQHAGVRFEMDATVDLVEIIGDGVRIYHRREGEVAQDEFDAVVIAVSPEHLRPKHLRVKGSTIPLKPLLALRPSRITKSNMRLRNPVRADEHATERYAMWYTTDNHRTDEHLATFFHGWEGQTPLSVWQMLRTALGHTSPARLLSFESQTWDGIAPPGEIPMAYISQPAPGQCLPLLRLARDQFFLGLFDAGPLRLASHALGCGGSVREAVLTGEWAAISLMRGWGFDITPALGRRHDPQRELFGAAGAQLDAELG